MSITFFFRKSLPQFNSIEELFNAIINKIPKELPVSKIEVPVEGAGFKSLFTNLKFAKKNRTSVNHITGHINYIALATGKNTILTIHDVGSNIYGGTLKKLLLKLLWFWIPALLVKRITVISAFSKSELVKLIPFAKNKIQVIHNPVKEELSFNQKSFNKEKPVILHLGTKTNKNLERTIEALKDIPCTLMIIGRLTETQQSLLQNYQIDYTNKYYIPFDKIIEAYQQCDLVSFASTYEGFGMPIVEAQAIGRPVLTSNCCSMPEVAGDGAHIVDPYSKEEIKKGILKIIEDDSYREQLIQNGLENVKRFRLQHIVDQYMELYQEFSNQNIPK